MDPSKPIILYDIPSPHPNKAWSPNTWKTRYCLNYKGLHYRTEWVEYPDIKALYEHLGIEAKSFNEDGSPYHSLPVISDPSTGQIMSESFDIARYLDDQYPSKPKVFPPGSKMLIRSFQMFFGASISDVFELIVPEAKLNEASWDYYAKTRAKRFGKEVFEETKIKGEARREKLARLETGLESISGLYKLNEKGNYVMGETLSFADIAVASLMMWFSLNLAEWKEMQEWHGGRWGKSLALLEKYSQVL
jgi:glutathione S-transferase